MVNPGGQPHKLKSCAAVTCSARGSPLEARAGRGQVIVLSRIPNFRCDICFFHDIITQLT